MVTPLSSNISRLVGLNTFRGAAGWYSPHREGSTPAQLAQRLQVPHLHLLSNTAEQRRSYNLCPTTTHRPESPGHTSGRDSGTDSRRQTYGVLSRRSRRKHPFSLSGTITVPEPAASRPTCPNLRSVSSERNPPPKRRGPPTERHRDCRLDRLTAGGGWTD